MTDKHWLWKDKRVLVSGGAGFLGSCVVAELRRKGCVDIFVPRSSDYDLVDAGAVKKLYRDARPQIVFHLAAKVGGIQANKENPGRFFYDNLIMGVQMMEQARLYGTQKFLAVGTVCSYPKFTPVPFREEDIWNGYPEETNAAYGLAKKMLLVQSLAYRQQYGFSSIFLIPTNLYGPNDNFDLHTSHVIPALIRKFSEAAEKQEEEVLLWGTGKATRDFLFVEDCAAALVMAAQSYDSSDPVNIGTGKEYPISEIASMISALLDYRGRIKWDSTRPDGQPRRCLEVSRAEKEFGFRARISLDEGLRRTIDWYKRKNVK